MYGGGTANVSIRNGHFHSSIDNSITLDVSDGQGIEFSGNQVYMNGTGTIGVKIAGSNSSNNRISNNKFDMVKTSVQIAAPSNITSSNTFTSLTSQTSTTHISYLSGALLNTAVGNTMTGFSTNGIVYASGANTNTACANTIDPANITNPIVDSGSSNTTTCGGGGSSSALAPVNSPAALWVMNKGTGSTFEDFGGLANTQTAGGTVTWTTGPGTCYVCPTFDATFDTLSANHTRFNPDTADPFSVSAWVSFSDLTASQTLAAQLGVTNEGWFIFKNFAAGTAGQGNKWIVGLQDAAAVTSASVIFDATAAASTLYHVVMTYNGGATIADIHLYVNGVDQAQFFTLSDNLAGSIQPDGEIYVASWSANTANRLSGTVSNVSLYNRVLTQADVSALFATGPLTTLWVAKQ